MKNFSTFEEVLEFAISREIEANQFYTELAQQMEDAVMRKVFEDLAREELGHKAKLEAMKKNKVTAAREKVADLKIADYIVNIDPKEDMSYKDALVLAMQKEKAAFNLYTNLAEEIVNPDQKEVFLQLAQEEARHKLRFEMEYDDVVLKDN